jgi:hypothetical protein
MSLEDLRRFQAEAQGVPYIPLDKQRLLDAADEAKYQQDTSIQQEQQMIVQSQKQGTMGGFMDNRPYGVDVYFLDRMLTIELPQKEDRKGLWITEGKILEMISLSNFDKEAYNYIRREYLELVAVASGEGNEQILQDKIGEFLTMVAALKGSSFMKEVGQRERTIWATHKTTQESTVRMPEEQGKKGFLGLFG